MGKKNQWFTYFKAASKSVKTTKSRSHLQEAFKDRAWSLENTCRNDYVTMTYLKYPLSTFPFAVTLVNFMKIQL